MRVLGAVFVALLILAAPPGTVLLLVWLDVKYDLFKRQRRFVPWKYCKRHELSFFYARKCLSCLSEEK